MSNELTQVKNAIALQEAELAKALPKHIKSDKFVRVLQTAVLVNQKLISADRNSLFESAQRAASMGLLPDGREGAIVEFGNRCQFMPMIAGILKLIRQSGQVSTIDSLIVCKGDKFQYRPGIDEVPLHEPDWFGDRGEMIGVYAVCRLKDGAAMVEIMSMRDVEKVRNAGRSANSPAWKSWGDEMARKSVLRRLAKRLPSSTDIDFDAVFADEDETAAAPSPAAEPAPAPAQKKSRLAAAVADAPTDVSDATVIDSAGQVQHESPV
jgi:recombination protein RecT